MMLRLSLRDGEEVEICNGGGRRRKEGVGGVKEEKQRAT